MKDYYGWIKLHRQIQNHWVYKIDGEYSKFHAWCDLLMNANFKQTKIVIKDTVIILEQGQQARSVLTLVKEWKWSKNKVLRFLELLKNDSMIGVETNHLTTIITICNYSSFQLNDTTGETPHDTAHETPCDTSGDTQYKKDNKEENEKNDLIVQDADAPSPLGVLMTNKKGEVFPVYETDFDLWQETYQAVDIQQELKKIKAWLDANPTKRKTKQGMKKFINSWLSRAQDNPIKQQAQRVSVLSDFIKDSDFNF